MVEKNNTLNIDRAVSLYLLLHKHEQSELSSNVI